MTKPKRIFLWTGIALLVAACGYGVYSVVERYMHPEKYRFEAEVKLLRTEVLKHMPWAEEKGSSEKLMAMLGDLAVADWQAMDGGWWKKAKEMAPKVGAGGSDDVEDLWDGDFGESSDYRRLQIRGVFNKLSERPDLVNLLCSEQAFTIVCTSSRPIALLPEGKPLLTADGDVLFHLNPALGYEILSHLRAGNAAVQRILALWIAGRSHEAHDELLAFSRHVHRLIPLCTIDLMVLQMLREKVLELALAMHDEGKLTSATSAALCDVWLASPHDSRAGAWFEGWASLSSVGQWQNASERAADDGTFDSEDMYSGATAGVAMVGDWLKRSSSLPLESVLENVRTGTPRTARERVGQRLISFVVTYPTFGIGQESDDEPRDARALREYCGWYALSLAARETDAERQEFIAQAKDWEPIRFTVTWEPLDGKKQGQRLTVRAELGPLPAPHAKLRFKPETVRVDMPAKN